MALSTLVETPAAPLAGLRLLHDSLPLPLLEDRQPEINVLLSVQRTQPLSAPYQHETIQAFPRDTVKDLKVRLRNRGWYKQGHWVMVFGNRELLESETVEQVVRQQSAAGEGTGNYLHIFLKLSDIEGIKVTSLTRELSFGHLSEAANSPGSPGSPLSSPKSALTSALLSSPEHDNSRALIPLPGAGASSAISAVEDNSQAVIHLMIRRSAKVSWRHSGGESFELSVNTSTTPDTVKRLIQASHGSISAEEHQLMCDGKVLKGGKSLSDYGVGKDAVLELVPVEPNLPGGNYPDGSPLLKSPSHELFGNWQKAQAGLQGGNTPKLASAGAGGSYFLTDVEGHNVAVFKPQDEEPNAVNNPRGLVTSAAGEGLRKGTRAGEGAVREVAAYVLDHEHFAGVPPTALVNFTVAPTPSPGTSPVGSDAGGLAVTKVGSLQQFVIAEFDCEERGTSSIPVSEVHKIAVLDIRLANADRNGSNILARRIGSVGTWQLIPIDHGYILPATLEDINFEWLFWPQAKVPFDETTLAYISKLDAEKDVQLLASHQLPLRPECLRVLRICTMLLKKCAVRGLSPYQIGCIMSRQAFTQSPLEKLHHHALHLAANQRALSSGITAKPPGRVAAGQFVEEVYMQHLARLLDEYLEEFLLDNEDDVF